MIRNPHNLNESLSDIPYILLERIREVETVSLEKPLITNETYNKIRKGLEGDLKIAEEYKPYSLSFLLMLFEKHLSKVPSVTREVYVDKKEELQKHPDISLFHHLKLTAAIAACLCNFLKETHPKKWNNNELLKDEILNTSPELKPFLLIGGDISGVQKFIYTITSKGALRSLKGRSFYLELLAEHVVSELLDALNLSRCNIIFSGGGHFYILSHNTSSAHERVKDVKERVDDFLLDEFKGAIQLHLSIVSFDKSGFKDAVPVWRALSNNLEMLKKKKWEDRLYSVLKIEGQHEDCETMSCEVCFREDLPLVDLKRDDDTIKVCNPCYSQYILGTALSKISKAESPVIYKLTEKPNGDYMRIMDSYYQIKKGWDKDLHEDAKAVYRINDFNPKHYSHPNSIYIPIGIYQHNSIEEISDALNVYGINRIGVLRMDVDNLGRIFSDCVPHEDRTFSRMSSISKGLNQFFKYHLNYIVEGNIIEPCDIANRNVKKMGRRLSIVYSGGDDLFIIGHWLDVIECAVDINTYFKKYTGNDFITISGGISINHEHHPVYQFAGDAKEAEERAKNGRKNAIAIFMDKRFEWNMFSKVIDRIKLFKNFLKPEKDHFATDEERLPKTFFYRLLTLAKRFNKDGVLILPKAAYLISRARFKKSNPEDILKIKEVVMNTSKDEWQITEAATLITLMLMRKGGQNA